MNAQPLHYLAAVLCVFGQNNVDHDDNLVNLMNLAADKRLVFNSTKCAIKTDSISFFRNLYTADGIKPDPAKLQDIHKMSMPGNKEELDVVSQFNGTSTPKGSYSAKQVTVIATSIQIATVQVLHRVRAIRYQVKSEQNVRQDLIPRGATWRLL